MKKIVEYLCSFIKEHRKRIIIMRNTVVILLISTFQLFASGSYSQTTKLSLELKGATIKEVLLAIEDQSEFYFLYNSELIDVTKKVNISSKGEKVENILTRLFNKNEVSFFVKDRYIILTPDKEIELTTQQKSITGKVTDESGLPLPGVTVRVKGTTLGTVTDIDGNYKIALKSNDVTLVFSFIGFTSQEIVTGGKTEVDVVLKESIHDIDEVVVVGYGTQKKINLTGAVETVSSDEISNSPVSNVAQILQGRVANLRISVTNQGGEPGATQNMNIRGIGSIGLNNRGRKTTSGKPYVLVDGVPMDINLVNPEDVASITVLKDAASSAIYGARAPYGVILITTKSGKENEKLSISYSNNFVWSSPTIVPKVANSMDAALAMNYSCENSGSAPLYDEETLQRIQDYLDGKIDYETTESTARPNRWNHNNKGNANNDWYSIFYKDWATRQKHNLSMRGGSERLSFFVSTGLYDQSGQLRWGDEYYKRNNITANVSSKITDWLRFDFRTKYARTETQMPIRKDLIWHDISKKWPSNPLYYPNGEFSATSNVSLLKDGGKNWKAKDDLWMTFGFELEPVEGWKTKFEYSWNHDVYKETNHTKTIYGTYPDGTKYIRNNPINSFWERMANNDYYILHLISSYEKTLGGHYLKIMGGYEQELAEYARLTGSKKQLVTENVPTISTATGDPDVDDDWSHWATEGVFMRFNYNFKEKYLFEFNARYDGSSKFMNAETQWGFFPSASIGYNISKEAFWSDLENVVNNLKFRASWGSLGDHNVPNYSYIPILPIKTNLSWIMGDERPVYTLAPGLLSNALTWQTSTTMDFGLDAGFLNNRMLFSFDWYNRVTSNMHGPAEAVPSVLGTKPAPANNAEIGTKGFELSLSWNDRIGKVRYNARFILGDNTTKVLKYPNPTKILSTWYEGQELGEIWGYESAGFFKDKADVDAWVDQTAFYKRWQAGDIKYVDLNGDDEIGWGENTLEDHGDKKIIGNSMPHYN